MVRPDVPEIGDRIPLLAIDRHGIATQIATVCPLADGGFRVEPDHSAHSADTRSSCLIGESGTGVYEDLPWFLDDLRPQGFLGKRIAQKLAESGGYPPDPRYWRSHHLIRFLLEHGADLPGNLLLGEQAVRQFNELRWPEVERKQFGELARNILVGQVYGSSAGGEQPKFAALTERGHVIVKFSPAGDSPSARRWQDLLVAEHLALRILADKGIAAAESEIWKINDRLFLESSRFDRVERRGRKAAVSLRAVDAEFAGIGQNWAKVAEVLVAENMLDAESAEQMLFLQTFGEWIGNNDMHLGNLSLAPADSFLSGSFSLRPVYDMLPMLYAPIRDELVERPWHPPAAYEDQAETRLKSGRIALRFWQRVVRDSRISESFKRIAAARERETELLLASG